jgi:hypothetical protein
VAFNLQGEKNIGLDANLNPIVKYSTNFNSGAGAKSTISNLEWDAYAISATGNTYDISSACNPQPENLAPGGFQITNVYFAAHTANSFLVDVRSALTGAYLTGAIAALGHLGSTTTVPTDLCGEAFFPGLVAASDYTLDVGGLGYTTSTVSTVNIAGRTRQSVSLSN